MFPRAELPLLDLLRELPYAKEDKKQYLQSSKGQYFPASFMLLSAYVYPSKPSHPVPWDRYGEWVAEHGELLMRETVDNILSKEMPFKGEEKSKKRGQM